MTHREIVDGYRHFAEVYKRVHGSYEGIWTIRQWME